MYSLPVLEVSGQTKSICDLHKVTVVTCMYSYLLSWHCFSTFIKRESIYTKLDIGKLLMEILYCSPLNNTSSWEQVSLIALLEISLLPWPAGKKG